MKTIPTVLTIENGCELWGDLNNGRHVRIATLQQWPQLDNRRVAALFAAAPDLLAAIERLLDEENPFETDIDSCECGIAEDGTVCAHMEAHRAIAKARGRTVEAEQPAKTVVNSVSEFKKGDRVQIIDRIHPHFPRHGTFVKYDQLWQGAGSTVLITLDPGEGIGGTEGCYVRKNQIIPEQVIENKPTRRKDSK